MHLSVVLLMVGEVFFLQTEYRKKESHLHLLEFYSVRMLCILLKLYADNHYRDHLGFHQILNRCKVYTLARRLHQ